MSKCRSALIFGALLLLAAMAVWTRDLHWTSSLADSLPLALGIPATLLLGMPWTLGGGLTRPGILLAIVSTCLFAAGWVTGSITLLAVSWTGLAISWMNHHFSRQDGRGRLAWILLLSFPWLVLEWPQIGWWCRYSAAWVGEGIFNLLALPVSREGTSMVVLGVPVEVEEACAGWNLLQLTLLTGVAFGAHEIRSQRRFYWLLMILPLLAWAANVLRILVLSALALSFGLDLASGALHGMMGLAVLGLVLGLTKCICHLLDARSSRSILVTRT